MTRRLIVVVGLVLLLVAGGAVAYNYMFTSTTSYANYTAPTFEQGITDEQRIFALQNDLGNSAAEMAQLQDMAAKLQFGKMKAMGRHLQQVASQLQPRLDEIEDRQARRLLAEGVDGLRIVGEGSEELDKGKSLQGVNQVLAAFEKLNDR